MKRILAALLAAASAACDDNPESHVYQAEPFVPGDHCFAQSESLGYIDTPDGSLACDATCIVLPATATRPEAVYVSTMCGPYPSGYEVSPVTPGCAAALAAWPAEQAALACGLSSCASLADGGGPDVD